MLGLGNTVGYDIQLVILSELSADFHGPGHDLASVAEIGPVSVLSGHRICLYPNFLKQSLKPLDQKLIPLYLFSGEHLPVHQVDLMIELQDLLSAWQPEMLKGI